VKLPLATAYALGSHHPYGGPPGAFPESESDTLIVSACPTVTVPLWSPVTTTPANAKPDAVNATTATAPTIVFRLVNAERTVVTPPLRAQDPDG
jgi:hypothetical protein